MSFSEYFPIWDKLSGEHKNKILEVAEFREAKKGSILHSGGLECLGLIVVRSGQLRAYILSDEGREISICRFFERDICLLSASCVMPDMQFDITIEAEKDSQFWVVPACLFRNLMDESLPISNYANNLISGHFTELMWLMEQIMWKSIDKRLAAFLLDEIQVEGTSCLNITHEKIGNHLGTAREVVTRMLRYFQNEGMVKLTRGAVEVRDEKKLEALCDT